MAVPSRIVDRRGARDPGRRRRRWVVTRVVLLAAAGLAVLALLAALSAVGIRQELVDARQEILQGRRALVAGDAELAAVAFAESRDAFGRARDRAGGGALGVLRYLPILGRTPDAIVDLSTAGGELAAAGEGLARGAALLPDGVATLAPRDGAVPVDAVISLRDEVVKAEERARRALATVRAAPTSMLLPPVGAARADAEDLSETAHRALLAGRRILEGLPTFLGVDRPARYFFVAQNPAEQRGTGGIMGAFSILRIDDGRFRFTPFRGVQTLGVLDPGEVEAPNEDYARNYDRYGGAGFLLNINMTPDFPSAAQAILAHQRASAGLDLDGVIAADPFALAALLRSTGPSRIPGLDVQVDAENVVAFTANRAYREFDTQAERKRILGAVAQGVFERFLAQPAGGPGRLRALADAAAGGHLLAYSEDASMQEGLELAGAAGHLPSGPGDFLAIVANNAAGNKVDFYEERSVRYAVALSDGGRATATTDVTTVNRAPTSGPPKYVLGPFVEGATPGENVTILHTYCGPGCALRDASRDGRQIEPPRGTELGRTFFYDDYRVSAGERSRLRLRSSLDGVWVGNSSGGVYRFTWLGQTTIRATELRVEVRAPDGMSIVRTSEPMRTSGSVAVWEGVPGPRLELEVEFAPSLPVRMWRDLTRFLSRPVIRF